MKICLDVKCTGCAACVNACKRRCISMREDELGALHPIVDENKCIQCGLCSKVCPNNLELAFHYPKTCYASWIKDSEKRKICASGGIGTILSEYVLGIGGVVFGSRYNDSLVPIMTYTESVLDLDYFKGSRYVQSIVGNETFQKVKAFLNDGRMVLFVGTPCQVAGLMGFLRKEYENLITVDLICHGVSPTKYLMEEIGWLSQKYHIKGIKDIRFRGNDGNNFRLTLWNKDSRKLFPGTNYREKILRLSESQQYYITGFLKGITMRENCYTCNYARPERISDITIGDFIGLGREVPFSYPTNNVSSVLINTPKGEDFYKKVSEIQYDLVNVERNYEERLKYRPSLMEPFKRHKLNYKFVKLYKKYGYLKAIHLTLWSVMLVKQMKVYLHVWTYIYRIPRKVYRLLIQKS